MIIGETDSSADDRSYQTTAKIMAQRNAQWQTGSGTTHGAIRDVIESGKAPGIGEKDRVIEEGLADHEREPSSVRLDTVAIWYERSDGSLRADRANQNRSPAPAGS